MPQPTLFPSLPRRRSRAARLSLLAATAALAACEPQPAVAPPPPEPPDLSKAYAAAFEAEAKDSASVAPYLDLVDAALAHPDAPGALAAGLAALDAIAAGSVPDLEGLGSASIAYRSRESFPEVVKRLRQAWSSAPPASAAAPGAPARAILRGEIAGALHEMALFQGDESAAGVWSTRRGCAQTATVIAPLDWTPLRGLEDALPIGPDEPIRKGYAGIAPFAGEIAPAVVHADGCMIDMNATSFLQGTRALVVDVIVPHPETIHLALASASAAVVDVGGLRAMRRGFEDGSRPVLRFASADVPQGTVRVVVKVAQRGEGNQIELDVWGDDGQPLRTHAPRAGESAKAKATRAAPVDVAPGRGEAAALLGAGGLLAVGDARAAEHLLEPAKNAPPQSPAAALLYARALEIAEDLPDAKMNERIRAAVDRVAEAWPGAWEGKIGHARVTERRKGIGEGVAESLRELGVRAPASAPKPAGSGPSGSPAADRDRLVTAYVAITANRAQLHDVAEDAYAELARVAPGSPLLASVDARLHGRSGEAAVKAACKGGLPRSETECLDALRERGDFKGALDEVSRLRKLRDAPDGLRDLELSIRLQQGDLAGALNVYDSMQPAERRMLDVLGLAAGRGDIRNARQRYGRDRATSRDAPYGIDPLIRALGVEGDPAPRLEADGRKLVLADQDAAFLPGAATAVLRHTERYQIDDNGLVHYVLYDLRRVSGTTDVAGGGVTYGPAVEGRGAPRLLRRRIHKKDGRVLEPDAAANAAQASDLSQLETGDYVEQIVEGWALPSDTGQIVIDTPDLLPERTSVREATIEVRRASSIPFSLWAHPLLGKAAERADGPYKVTTWQMKDQAPRRIEDGVPKMERSCGVSFGTQTWAQVARALDENVRSLDEHDPYVARWAAEAAGEDKTPSRALVERVVAAAGKKVKVAGGGELSDVAAVFSGGGQRTTARTILELGQGSRSWVIYRALRELGVKVDLAVAETEPFSAAADFPPHVGRFRHPLVIAHVAEGDVWIDSDIDGPPLPPGRISPELRGRAALLASGEMVTVAGTTGETGDEVDVRLELDDQGNAKGVFTVLLHGRVAQSLAEAFETVVGTDRREMLRSVVLGWVPWADVDDVTVSSTEGSWEVALRATIAVHGYSRPEGKDGKIWVLPGLEPVHVVFPRAPASTLGATYASRGARQNALSIDSPIQYHLHRRVELPAGATIARAPSDLDVRGPNLTASRKGTVTGQVIEDSFVLSLPTGTVAADGYQAFVEKVQAVDNGFMAGMRIKVKP
jgi:hypothetical protein